MKPTSLLARLLALTPHGRRLFAVLGSQQAELERLRVALAERDAPPPAQGESPEAALRTLLAAAEVEARFNRARLPPAGNEQG